MNYYSNLFFFLMLLFGSLDFFAQDTNASFPLTPVYFYTEDLVYNKVHYLLTCKEIDKDGLELYEFEVIKDKGKPNLERTASFSMLDIKPNEKSNLIFRNYLEGAIKEFSIPKPKPLDSDEKQKIENIMFEIREDRKLDKGKRDEIESLIVESSILKKNNIDSLNKYFENLNSVLIPEDSIWLTQKIKDAITKLAKDASSIDVNSLNDSDNLKKLKKLVAEVKKARELSEERKDEIESLIVELSFEKNRDSLSFANYFENLSSTLVLSDRSWLSLKLDTAKIKIAEYQEDAIKSNFQPQDDFLGTSYLFNAHKKATPLNDKAPEVGTLYVEEKVDLYTTSSGKLTRQINRLEKKKKRSNSTEKAKNLETKLKLKKEILKARFSETNSLLGKDLVLIDSVSLEFEYEKLANVKVLGQLIKSEQKVKVEFQNRVPISYSTKADVSRDKLLTRLYEVNDLTEHPIILKDVLWNDYKLLNGTENYSPKDQVVVLRPGEKGKIIKKERVSNILKAKVFSDVIGLNETSPNGLIQTEFSHRFYLNSKIYQWGSSNRYLGFMNSVNPKISLTKLEDNNRILELQSHVFARDTISGTDSVQLFVSTIDVFSHTAWSSGGELNFAHLGVPNFHSNIYFNFGAFIRNVPFRAPNLPDSVYSRPFRNIVVDEDRRFNLNMAILYPEITWVIHPHSNLRLSFNAKYIWQLHFVNSDFKMVSNRLNYFDDRIDDDPQLLSLKFQVALRPNDDTNGEFFFRSFYSFVKDNPDQNFFQAQVGYAFNIFDRKNAPAPRQPFDEL